MYLIRNIKKLFVLTVNEFGKVLTHCQNNSVLVYLNCLFSGFSSVSTYSIQASMIQKACGFKWIEMVAWNVVLATDFPQFDREIVAVDLDVRMTCMIQRTAPAWIESWWVGNVVVTNRFGTNNRNMQERGAHRTESWLEVMFNLVADSPIMSLSQSPSHEMNSIICFSI